MTQQIELSKNRGIVLVNDDDYEWLAQYHWMMNCNGYAICHWKEPGTGRDCMKLMHRLIMGAPPGSEVDHIDHNKLNNQRSNLRFCTHAGNQHNQRKRSGFSSQYKGVSWAKSNRKWRAQIKINRQQNILGYFTDEIEAARAYDAKARELFGEFAHTNFEFQRGS